ncbi:MAG: dihydrolipoamide acetyltransferase [Myxococcales bacterium FL481]|nr:MAG: dihydrolipoamide acetyltransferase [Myxococcales bacterium FL481]
MYGERLSRLEADVEQLKEKVFRTRARLSLLKETVLHGVMAGSRTIIAHRNLMGAQFRLVKIVYFLDDAQVFARRDDDGALDSEEEIIVFDGNLVPGPHNATLELTYRGRGSGAFSYLNGYVFESRSSHSFTASEGGSVKIVSAGFEQGNLTTEMSDRPAVSWQELGIDSGGRPTGETRSRKSATRPRPKARKRRATRRKRRR